MTPKPGSRMELLAPLIPFEPDWNLLAARAIRIGLIVAGGTIACFVLRLARGRVHRMRAAEGAAPDAEFQRRKTLGSVLTRAGLILILSVTLMMVLEEVGIALAPLLATAGIAGLAIGFGAQTLVKDIISGVFILIENQYAIGDVIETAGVDGVVEEVNLRTTLLRDLHGVVHVVPNGEIRVLSNKTKDWSRAVLEVAVGYREDPDRVIAILEEVAAGLADDPVYGALLLESPTVPGVEAFGESTLTIRMMAKTLPLRQWDVARELRRRIKRRFDKEGIEMPFPQRVVWQRPE
ncbi:MAG TPA: mechanosensitive ion channel family protein [Gemmatimonadota bacterium]|nr:mechanosensitive ion channel family protein [Gemmatimonadota bacterium]